MVTLIIGYGSEHGSPQQVQAHHANGETDSIPHVAEYAPHHGVDAPRDSIG